MSHGATCPPPRIWRLPSPDVDVHRREAQPLPLLGVLDREMRRHFLDDVREEAPGRRRLAARRARPRHRATTIATRPATPRPSTLRMFLPRCVTASRDRTRSSRRRGSQGRWACPSGAEGRPTLAGWMRGPSSCSSFRRSSSASRRQRRASRDRRTALALAPSDDPEEVAERQRLTTEAVALLDQRPSRSSAVSATCGPRPSSPSEGARSTPAALRAIASTVEQAVAARLALEAFAEAPGLAVHRGGDRPWPALARGGDRPGRRGGRLGPARRRLAGAPPPPPRASRGTCAARRAAPASRA